MGLRSLVGRGVGGLGLCCFPAAFEEGPATCSGWDIVACSRAGLVARLFFAGGFVNVSGLSSSRVVILGEVVGSWGRVKVRGWMDRDACWAQY